jgi:hypothetical protein
MFDLTKLINSAYGGEAAQTLARSFSLSPEQGRKAFEALAPAFAMGLNRSATSPADFMALMNNMVQASAAMQAGQNQLTTLSKTGIEFGQELVERLFGSNELTKAIADQTARFTGMGQDTMMQIMPAYAAMMAGSLTRPPAGFDNPFAAWMKAFAPVSAPAATPDLAAFTESMSDLARANPFLAPFVPEKPKPKTLSEETAAAVGEAVNKLFHAGLEAQGQQLDQLEQLFRAHGPKAEPTEPPTA